MSVLTAARIPHQPTGKRPAEVDLNTLPADTRERIEQALEDARNALDNDVYFAHMDKAIEAAGIRRPRRGELVRCGCASCNYLCDVLYDGDDPDARLYNDGAHEIPQCPGCADRHPGRDAE